MAFGLAGAHRTGKSTLAKAVSEKLDLHFYDGSSGRIMRELGYNSVANMELPRRIEAQRAYLERYCEEIYKIRTPFITDRTPLDMIAYMLGEVGMHSDPAYSEAVEDYVASCVAACNHLFDTVILVRPFGTYVIEEGKPAFNGAYQTHIQMLIEGAATLTEATVQRLCVDELDGRIESVSEVLRLQLGHMASRRDHLLLH